VVYLNWGPLGVEPFERFAASYKAHDADLEHRLVVALKGTAESSAAARFRTLADEVHADCLEVPASGVDLDSYAAAARRLEAGRLCFLNSTTEILADGWLAALGTALERPQIGLVGATGSNESAFSIAPLPLRPLRRRRYPAFPNPHVRTNAFMLERDLMLELDWPVAGRKGLALELESGRRSITRQIVSRGLDVLVVGADGCAYEARDWHASRTFRSGLQENLLIADNRTRQYADASPVRREQLARLAWGDRALLEPASRTPSSPA
jgi:hypothetical protein